MVDLDENVPKGDPHNQETPDNLEFSMEEFIGFWKQGKIKVYGSTGLVSVAYHKLFEKALRKLVDQLQHMGFDHNPEGHSAHEKIVKTHKMPLAAWKDLLLVVKVANNPGQQRDPVAQLQAMKSLRDGSKTMRPKSSPIIQP